MKKLIFTGLTFLMILCFAQSGSASTIMYYTATHNSGDEWTLTFDLTNGSTKDVWAVDIEFDDGSGNLDSFSNLVSGSLPAGWSADIFAKSAPTDPFIFAPFNDTGSDLGPGDSGVFSVSFDWTGTDKGTLDGFFYTLYYVDDTGNEYAVAGTGLTEPKPDGPDPIPEPGTMVLFGLGLLGTAAVSRKK